MTPDLTPDVTEEQRQNALVAHINAQVALRRNPFLGLIMGGQCDRTVLGQAYFFTYVVEGRCTVYVDRGRRLWFAFRPEALRHVRWQYPGQSDASELRPGMDYREDQRVVAFTETEETDG